MNPKNKEAAFISTIVILLFFCLALLPFVNKAWNTTYQKVDIEKTFEAFKNTPSEEWNTKAIRGDQLESEISRLTLEEQRNLNQEFLLRTDIDKSSKTKIFIIKKEEKTNFMLFSNLEGQTASISEFMSWAKKIEPEERETFLLQIIPQEYIKTETARTEAADMLVVICLVFIALSILVILQNLFYLIKTIKKNKKDK